MKNVAIEKVDGRYWLDMEHFIRVLGEADDLSPEGYITYKQLARFLDDEIILYEERKEQ